MQSVYQACLSIQIAYNDIVLLAYFETAKLFFDSAKHRRRMWSQFEDMRLFGRCVNNKTSMCKKCLHKEACRREFESAHLEGRGERETSLFTNQDGATFAGSSYFRSISAANDRLWSPTKKKRNSYLGHLCNCPQYLQSHGHVFTLMRQSQSLHVLVAMCDIIVQTLVEAVLV